MTSASRRGLTISNLESESQSWEGIYDTERRMDDARMVETTEDRESNRTKELRGARATVLACTTSRRSSLIGRRIRIPTISQHAR